jgi:hypothetical protein
MIKYVATVKKGGSRASEIKLKKQEKAKSRGSLFGNILSFLKKMF